MNNPLAFPQPEFQGFTSDVIREHGMTLRDYFAAKAMQGLLAAGLNIVNSPELDGYSARAEVAYKQADAMLKAREQ